MASGEAKKPTSAATKRNGASQITAPVVKLPPARRSVRLDRIIVGERLRPRDQTAVANLAVSMAENGLDAPVLLRPVKMDGDDVWYGLVAGGHRYDAAALLGWTHIDATIREMTDAQALLSEIDENLVRRDLTAYERAIFINARLKAWAAVHPERVGPEKGINLSQFADEPVTPKRGRPKNADRMSEFLGDTPATMGFNAETAADLGISTATVKRALAVARGLSASAHASISGTKLGKNEGLLRQIAGVADKVEQLKVVKALSDGRAKTFSDALVIASGRTPVRAPERPLDTSLKAFQKAWKEAPASHRVAMLRWLSEQHLGPFDLVEIGSRAR